MIKKTLLLTVIFTLNGMVAMALSYEKAVFAGGCFWCMEPPYDQLKGVVKTVSGYTGGTIENPTYNDVSAGITGHKEAIEITYDPEKVSYETLLETFWLNVDPFDAGGQFCDRGSQYGTAIFYQNERQKKLAEESIKKKQQETKEDVITPLIEGTVFYPAEDYHQDYYQRNPLRYKLYRYSCGRDERLKEIKENN